MDTTPPPTAGDDIADLQGLPRPPEPIERLLLGGGDDWEFESRHTVKMRLCYWLVWLGWPDDVVRWALLHPQLAGNGRLMDHNREWLLTQDADMVDGQIADARRKVFEERDWPRLHRADTLAYLDRLAVSAEGAGLSWPGNGGATDRAVFLAIVKTGRTYSTMTPKCARIDLAKATMTATTNTVKNALRRLQAAGRIRKVTNHHGSEAAMYLPLLPNSVTFDPETTKTFPSMSDTSGSLVTLLSISPAFEHRLLGKNGCLVLLHLSDIEARGPAEIQHRSGVSLTTVNRQLRKLQRDGLALGEDGRYRTLPRGELLAVLQDLAEETGASRRHKERIRGWEEQRRQQGEWELLHLSLQGVDVSAYQATDSTWAAHEGTGQLFRISDLAKGQGPFETPIVNGQHGHMADTNQDGGNNGQYDSSSEVLRRHR